MKLNFSVYSLHYAEACCELAEPISASLRPGNTAPFEEMLQRWRAVDNTVFDLTRGGVEDITFEVKAKEPKKIRGQGLGPTFREQMTLSRPRTEMVEAKNRKHNFPKL